MANSNKKNNNPQNAGNFTKLVACKCYNLITNLQKNYKDHILGTNTLQDYNNSKNSA